MALYIYIYIYLRSFSAFIVAEAAVKREGGGNVKTRVGV
jgi:hypothetical protein